MSYILQTSVKYNEYAESDCLVSVWPLHDWCKQITWAVYVSLFLWTMTSILHKQKQCNTELTDPDYKNVDFKDTMKSKLGIFGIYLICFIHMPL